MPVGVQLHGPRKRAERQTSSCTECRRRKQKVCIYSVSIFLSHFTVYFPLCFDICIAWTIHRLQLSCCGFGFFHHDIEAHEPTPHHKMVTFISS